ncbi:MAG: guanylate kinase [Pedosphaera sp.]|nr:guanylate kinase [Pedosphaera sp.]MST00945.1 guanylate kinase [Pedosphaera sp.]
MNSAANNALLIVLSAPSGGGKTTLCTQLLAANTHVDRAVTCTTRAPRGGECDGVDYFFLTREVFEQKLAAGEFLEHANVYGNFYGTLKSEVLAKLRAGRDVLLAIDVQGAASVRAIAQQDEEFRHALATVFLTPESAAVLEQRLHNRGEDAPEAVQKRLAVARQEVAQWVYFDYLIYSTSVAEDLRRMQTVLDAEKMRCVRVSPPNF